ncbi:uncharacterized protein LOC131666547 [Phymastichus coffea]|uniref:uncharacterized protein LOC131666547 n=1 Tax=Phymastichus coffea TaxID=108790 RepID=UPI00273AC38E|nr:uncharacterized protein LOC131666547 [Phymastichus coffea]
MSSKIQVAIKVRPLLDKEKEDDLKIQWNARNCYIERLNDQRLKRKRDGLEKFHFDYVFNSENNNMDVFEKVVKRSVHSALNGYNSTIVAYGQCNSGKSHIMLGTQDDHGIIQLAVTHMFDQASLLLSRIAVFKVSCFEIYNEKVNDLLNRDNFNLELVKTLDNLYDIKGCTEETITAYEDFSNILLKINENRRTRVNFLNKYSDKSHKVIRINIESRSLENSYILGYRTSQLNFVDLAGHKAYSGKESKEDFYINISLLTLSTIAVQLNQFSDPYKIIDYEESKLSKYLSNSIGGNACTTFICAVAPTTIKETQNTLWFAHRLVHVNNDPRKNSVFIYKEKVMLKICKFYLFLAAKIKNIRSKLLQLKAKVESISEEDYDSSKEVCMTKIINCNKNKLSINEQVPDLHISDIISAMDNFAENLVTLNDNWDAVYNCIKDSNSCNLLSALKNVEKCLMYLELRAELLQTLAKILKTETICIKKHDLSNECLCS